MTNQSQDHGISGAPRQGRWAISDRTWTVVGTVSTIWAILLALVLSDLDHLARWLSHNSPWFTPVLVSILIVLPAASGYLVGNQTRRTFADINPLEILNDENADKERVAERYFANVNAVLEHEAQAKVVWIISPRLFYDIYDPEFRKVVLTNKARNVIYRYIVPDSVEIRRNLITYRQIYRESEEDEMTNFVMLPDSGLSEFLTEVAIYDPGEPSMFGFAAPPSPRSGREDVMILSREVRHHFAKAFSDLWFEAKNTLP